MQGPPSSPAEIALNVMLDTLSCPAGQSARPCKKRNCLVFNQKHFEEEKYYPVTIIYHPVEYYFVLHPPYKSHYGNSVSML